MALRDGLSSVAQDIQNCFLLLVTVAMERLMPNRFVAFLILNQSTTITGLEYKVALAFRWAGWWWYSSVVGQEIIYYNEKFH